MFTRRHAGTIAVSLALCFAVTIRSSVTAHSAEQQAELAPSELTCEYTTNPLGVDTPQPRFGWLLKSDRRSQLQSAYRVLVATSEKQLQANAGNKWDSGKVHSNRSVNVEYRGEPLSSGETCYWKVRVWDKQGRPSAWSEPNSFEMGLLKQDDWKGQWIGVAPPSPPAEHLDDEKPDRVNLALVAKPSTSFVSGHETLDAVNDGFKPAHSNDKRYGAYGNWAHRGVHWVQYEWPNPVNVDSIDVYWFDDRAGVRLPKAARILYWDGKAFKPVKNPVGLGVEGDKYNTTTFEEVTTSKLKLEFDSDTASTGILEFRVYDAGRSPKFPPVVKVNRILALRASAVAPSPLLRKEFAVTEDVRRARVYVSGIGWSELYLNGRKVSDRVLDPAATDYDKRVFYATHDVTDLLKKGPNAMGVMLGNGWYCEPGRLRYGYSPRVLLQMEIEYADGSKKCLVSDSSWKVIDGPVRYNDFWTGEVYDARLERTGWNTPGYDDSKWKSVTIKESPGGFMQSQIMPPIKVNKTLRPLTMTNPKPGVYVYDLGQIFGGWARVKMRAPADTKVAIRYGAHLMPEDGVIDQRRYYRGGPTDHYTFKGDGEEIYEPRFTYHPVRYVQVEGYPGKLTIDDLEGRVTYSDVDVSSRFECSDPMLNKIHKNVHWTLTNGLFGMPLDCLYREHWAWTDPATITGSLYPRKHMPRFWTKWLDDIAHAQRPNGDVPTICPAYHHPHFDPAWGGNYPILVWYLYQYLDDERILERHYDGMKRIVDYHTSIAENHIVTRGRYGDHMLPGKSPGHEVFISKETPPPLVWTGYYYRGAAAIAQTARVLGHSEDAQKYAELAEKIKRAFNDKWLNRETHQYSTGSQTANLLPFALEIVPGDQRQAVLKNIVEDIDKKCNAHLHTGNTGTTCMIDTLAAAGHANLMYRVATAKTHPGWGYMVAQGATTIWESWGGRIYANGATGADSMIMWATIDEFFYNDLAGIRGPEYYGPAQMPPGFRRIEIRPHVVGDITHAKARFRSVRGPIASAWKKETNSLTLDVTIPAGSTAKASVPTMGLENVAVTESGTPVFRSGAFVSGAAGISGASKDGGYVTFDVGSGYYSFRLTGKRAEPQALDKRPNLVFPITDNKRWNATETRPGNSYRN